MSARTPDFYIGISTQNPPTIISIGQTIDGMEEVEVRLDQPDEEKLADFENKINNISTSSEPVTVTSSDETPIRTEQSVVETPIRTEQSVVETPISTEQSVVETPISTAQSVVETPISTEQSVVETPIRTEQSVVETPIRTEQSSNETPSNVETTPVPAPTNKPTNRLTNKPTNRSTRTGNTFERIADMHVLSNVASSLFGSGGADKNTKKHKITKRYKNKLIKRRKTKRSKK